MSTRPSLYAPAGTSQTSDTGRTPEEYRAAISVHSERNKDSSLFPGNDYRFLAKFLRRSGSPGPLDEFSPAGQPPTHIPAQPASPHTFLCIHRFRNGSKTITEYDGAMGLQDFQRSDRPDSADDHLVFMRGFPTPDWLTAIGAHFKVDPDFFRRHLDFMKGKDFYDQPGLRSSCEQMMQLKITTICTRVVAINPSQVKASRLRDVEEVTKYQKRLSRCGESIIRRLSVHNETMFTVEQTASFYVKTRKGTWTAIVWLDCGHDLSEAPYKPWSASVSTSPTSLEAPWQFECEPVIQHRPWIALKSQPNDQLLSSPPVIPMARSTSDPTTTKQSAHLLHSLYPSSLENHPGESHHHHNHHHQSPPADAMLALNGLFAFVAHSESQFLNFMARQIAQEVDTFEEHMQLSLANVRYNKALVDSHVAYLADVVATLEQWGIQAQACISQNGPSNSIYPPPSSRIPNNNSNTSLNINGSSNLSSPSLRPNTSSNTLIGQTSSSGQSYSSSAFDTPLRDYRGLLDRARSLALRCTECANDINSSAMLEESIRAAEQTARFGRLTMLAFFFLPLSLVTGLFGMNFQELGSGTLSIWVSVPVAGLVFLVSTVMAFPELVWKCLPNRWKPVRPGV